MAIANHCLSLNVFSILSACLLLVLPVGVASFQILITSPAVGDLVDLTNGSIHVSWHIDASAVGPGPQPNSTSSMDVVLLNEETLKVYNMTHVTNIYTTYLQVVGVFVPSASYQVQLLSSDGGTFATSGSFKVKSSVPPSISTNNTSTLANLIPEAMQSTPSIAARHNAGVVLGIVLGIVALSCIVLYWLRRRQLAQYKAQSQSEKDGSQYYATEVLPVSFTATPAIAYTWESPLHPPRTRTPQELEAISIQVGKTKKAAV
jgi:hypothetical protein